LYSLNYFNLLPAFISIFLLIISVFQLSEAQKERLAASEANREAAKARKEVLEVSRAIIDIAEIIPRSTGYGGETSSEDRRKLQEYSALLKEKLKHRA